MLEWRMRKYPPFFLILLFQSNLADGTETKDALTWFVTVGSEGNPYKKLTPPAPKKIS